MLVRGRKDCSQEAAEENEDGMPTLQIMCIETLCNRSFSKNRTSTLEYRINGGVRIIGGVGNGSI